MIEPHIHCAECGREIATKLKVSGGKTKDIAIAAGTQFVLVATPDGLAPVPRQVPLCPGCHEVIERQTKQAKAASKLIVPRMEPPTLRPVS